MPQKKKEKPDADGFVSQIDFKTIGEGEALGAVVTGVKTVLRGDVFDKSQYGEDSDTLLAVRIAVTEEVTFVYYMNAPKEGVPVNPSSNFAKWIGSYGAPPVAGQDVAVKMNPKGFYAPVLA